MDDERIWRFVAHAFLAVWFYSGAVLALEYAGTPVPLLGGTSLFLATASTLGALVILANAKEDDHG